MISVQDIAILLFWRATTAKLCSFPLRERLSRAISFFFSPRCYFFCSHSARRKVPAEIKQSPPALGKSCYFFCSALPAPLGSIPARIFYSALANEGPCPRPFDKEIYLGSRSPGEWLPLRGRDKWEPLSDQAGRIIYDLLVAERREMG